MKRNFDKLAENHFDLLVIGGGIYGAWTALDASCRGLKVALIEKGDWASGTSSASSKLIHGGLRYLQHFKFNLVKKSLRERRSLMHLAPHLVQPLRFYVPIYKGGAVSRIALQAGLTIYDFLAGRQGEIYHHQSFGPKEAKEKYPFVESAGLLGGFTYGDAQTDDFRFTLEVVKEAIKSGVTAVHYAEAVSLLEQEGKVVGAQIKDTLANRSLAVKAEVVVNSAGPWAPLLEGCGELKDSIRLTKGIHLVMPALPTTDAMLVMAASDKRVFFMIPWYGRTLLGTTDTDFQGNPDDVCVEEADVEYLLSAAGSIVKEVHWQRSSVISSFAGLRALINEPGKHPSAISREWQLAEPCKGLLASIGGKFTSARIDSKKIVDRVSSIMERDDLPNSSTDNLHFSSSPEGNYDDWYDENLEHGKNLGLDDQTTKQLIFRYGQEITKIFAIIAKEQKLAARLVTDLYFCQAEVVYTCENEMAITLEDILRRRLPVLILASPDISVCRQAAALAAPILDWSPERQAKEVRHVMDKWEKCGKF